MFAGGPAPFGVFSHDGLDHALTVPSAHGVRVFFERVGNVAFIGVMGIHAHDPLALFLGVLDLPIHPITIPGLGCDVNEQGSPIVFGARECRT